MRFGRICLGSWRRFSQISASETADQKLVGVIVIRKIRALAVGDVVFYTGNGFAFKQVGFRCRCGLADPLRTRRKNPNRFQGSVPAGLASRDLSRKLNCPVGNSEISLLTVYFGTHMRKNDLRIGKLSVVLMTSENDREAEQLKKARQRIFNARGGPNGNAGGDSGSDGEIYLDTVSAAIQKRTFVRKIGGIVTTFGATDS